MKRKDPLKILTNQTKANVSFLMMSSPNGTISSNVALNRSKLRKLLFTHYYITFYITFYIIFLFASSKCNHSLPTGRAGGGSLIYPIYRGRGEGLFLIRNRHLFHLRLYPNQKEFPHWRTSLHDNPSSLTIVV